jgi:hypothetical protein
MNGADVTCTRALSQPYTRTGYLAIPRFSSELGDDLVYLTYSRGAKGMTHGQKAPVSVGRNVTCDFGAAVQRSTPGFPSGDKVEGL